MTSSGATTPQSYEGELAPVSKDTLFDTIPADCDLDCNNCSVQYPPKFDIEEKEDLWQTGKEWATHIIIATGKTDWVRDVE